jgi:hypothetical protein
MQDMSSVQIPDKLWAGHGALKGVVADGGLELSLQFIKSRK